MVALITISIVPKSKPLSACCALASQVIGWIGVITLILLEVRKTPFYADDEPNSQIAAVLAYTHETTGHYIGRITRQWMTNEGRFFPMSSFEAVHLFTSINSRLAYKALEISVVVLCSALVGALVAQITKDRGVALLSAGVMIGVVQIRAWYDPTIAFSVLIPSVTIKVLITANCMLLATSARSALTRSFAIFVGTISWSYALFQYETSFFLFPALVLAVWWPRRGSVVLRSALTVLLSIPTIAALSTALILRDGLVVSNGYKLNLDSSLVFFTYIRQVFSAFPFSYASSDLGSFMPGLGIVIILFSAMVGVLLMADVKPRPTDRSGSLMVALLGLIFLLAPGLSTAISARWQLEVVWGLGYLVVFMEYVGVALLITSGIIAITKKLSGRKFKIARALVTLCLVFLIVGTATSNREVAARLEPITIKRTLFEDAVRDGFFNRIPENATIISPSTNPNGWVNPWYYQWLGGTTTHKISGVQNGMVLACTEAEKVNNCSLKGPWWGLVEAQLGDRNTVDVIGRYSHLDVDYLTTDLLPGSVYLIADKADYLPPTCRNALIKTERSNWIGRCNKSIVRFQQVINLLNAIG